MVSPQNWPDSAALANEDRVHPLESLLLFGLRARDRCGMQLVKTTKIIDVCVFLVDFRHFSGFCIADQPVTKNLFCVLGGHFLLCIIIFLDFGVHHL